MWKLVIPTVLVALTGCGGGGSGSGGGGGVAGAGQDTSYAIRSSPIVSAIGSTPVNTFIPSLVSAKFDSIGTQYIVQSGWYANYSVLSDPPVKIYRIPESGSPEDVTLSVLGGNFAVSVNYPLVADFNKDGIDDIFFPGFTDAPVIQENPSVAFLSRPGLSHEKIQLNGLAWTHGALTVDVNRDGWLDVVTSQGNMWINNHGTGFAYHNSTFRSTETYMGSGLCAGDFDGTGDVQIVVTDVMNLPGGLPLNDNWIVKLNNDLTPRKVATLPVPYFDRASTTAERSHDVSCAVSDLNNDGRQDIVVFSYLMDSTTLNKDAQSYVQIYLNDGNFQFTESTLPGYDQVVLATYTPKIIDFNQDGRPDLWLMNTATTGTSANQIWINNGSGRFEQRKSTEIESIISEFRTMVNGDTRMKGVMFPVKINNAWNFVVTGVSGTYDNYRSHVGYAKTQWRF